MTKKILLPMLLMSALSQIAGGAQAQTLPEFCAVALSYFVNPPSVFINQRGTPDGTNRWNSNLTYPNARCTIALAGRTHRANCFYNRGTPIGVSSAWYRTMEVNLDGCMGRLPPSLQGRFQKSADTDTLDDGTRVITTTWDADESGDADYKIEINQFINTDGTTFNTMQVSYTKH